MFNILNFRSINKKLLISFLLILCLGFYAFLSASFGILSRNEIKFYSTLEAQIMAYAIGILAGVVIYFMASRFIFKTIPFLYSISIIVACLTFIPSIGATHGGATRWIHLFGFSLQPAEILKFSIILWTAYIFKRYGNKLLNFKYISIFGISILPIFIILFLQKDLGSILIISSILFSTYFVAEFSRVKYLIIAILSMIMLMGVYLFLNPYAITRIKTLFNPDPGSGAYYQTEQAYIAIAGGEMYGRGIFSGIQKYKYLPEPAGDSIFATFAEETGFIVSAFLIIILYTIFIWIIVLSKNIKNIFEKYILFGIGAHFIFQVTLNIGSMIGITPLSGDTLPFFSQGGTSLIVNIVELAIVLNFTKVKDEDIII